MRELVSPARRYLNIPGIVLLGSVVLHSASYSQTSSTGNGATSFISLEGGPAYSWFSHADNFFFLYAYPYDVPIGSTPKKMYFASPGSGLGYTVGLTGEFPLYSDNGLRFGLHYDKLSTHSTDTRNNASPDITQNSSSSSFESSYTSSWTHFSTDVFFRQSLFQPLYFLIGAGFSYLLSDRLDASQKITSSDPNSQYVSLATHKPTSTQEFNVVRQTSFNYYNPYGSSLKFGMGAFIRMEKNLFISPELILSYPLSNFFTEAAQDIYHDAGSGIPKLWHVDMTFAIRYAIAGTTGNRSVAQEPPPVALLPESYVSEKENAPSLFISGKVKDCHTMLPVIADLVVIDLDSNLMISSIPTSIVGAFSIGIKKPGRYSITATARGYSFRSELFDLSDEISARKNPHEILLCPEGEKIRLLVFFDYDKAVLNAASYPELDRTARLIKESPGMKVEIAGYTDSVGSAEYNLSLSQKRAEAVRKYLLSKNIDSSRISVKGYGKEKPVATNETEEGRAENRRVEFVILK